MTQNGATKSSKRRRSKRRRSLAQIIPKRSIPVGFEDDKCLASTLHPSSCPRPAPGSRFTTSYARVDVCPKKVFYGESLETLRVRSRQWPGQQPCSPTATCGYP